MSETPRGASTSRFRRRRANQPGGRQHSHRVKVTPEEEAVLLQLALAQGVSVPRLRWAAVAITGVLCGLAGAYLAAGLSAGFVKEMTAGRGYIALAALIFADSITRRHLAMSPSR